MRVIVEFGTVFLRRLYEEVGYHDPQLGRELVKQYRKVVSLLVAVVDERDLRQLKSRRLEQLKGDRKGQSSLRLHEGHRLIVTFRTEPAGRVVAVVEIIKHDDY